MGIHQALFVSIPAGGTGPALGLSNSLLQVTGSGATYTQRSVDLSAYANSTVRLVWRVVQGIDSATEIRIDSIAISAESISYTFSAGNESFETSTSSNANYSSITFSSVQNTSTQGRWYRNALFGGQNDNSRVSTVSQTFGFFGYNFWLRSPEITLGSSPGSATFYELRDHTDDGTTIDFYVDVISTSGGGGGGGSATPDHSIFTSSTSWTVPTNVTSVAILCVGAGGGGGGCDDTDETGGGGGGGALAYANSISTTPGETLTITVGTGGSGGGTGGGNGGAGGNSSVSRGATVLCSAGGGSGGLGGRSSSNAAGGTVITGTGGAGGAGGSGSNRDTDFAGGGGGAGGYAGSGGAGGNQGVTNGATAGSGGGGGGGGRSTARASIGAGGGVGIYGQGTNGAAGQDLQDGGGGSGGSGGNGIGGLYGGGGGGGPDLQAGYSGANGAVRILWGTGRSFPSTNVSSASA